MKGLLVLLLLASAAAPACAQELGWRRTLDASGNVFFGSARSRLVALGAGAGRADSTLDLRFDGQLNYADARDDDGVRGVTARSSRLGFAADLHPFARWSPFAFAAAEASLQQRIDRRVSSGAGAKLTVYRNGWQDASVSLAMLWERTRALDVDTLTLAQPSFTRVRWSLRTRLRRQLSPTLRLSHVTFWQPSVERLGRYTIDSSTSVETKLADKVSLTATLRDRIDSEARGRGARSNHDGQLLFGVRAAF